MASISKTPNGQRVIQFVGPDGARRSIRLGKVSQRTAESIKVRIECLAAARRAGHVPDDATAQWVDRIDGRLADRLARAGLIPKRESVFLGDWLRKYLASRSDLKPKSLAALGDTADKLLAHFGEAAPLRNVSCDAASDWRQSLVEAGLSPASVKHHVGNAKGLFAEAVRRGLIPCNPLRHLTAGTTAANIERYVTPDETEQIIEQCPSVEWKLLIGMARYAGLRVPSETRLVTWSDVDWHRARLLVRSPKTEHHPGHGSREVPITPGLMDLLRNGFDRAPEGQSRVVSMAWGGNVRRTFLAILKRAGIEPWPRLWQTLRASCERQWAMTYPQYAVSKWIGHSITVSGRHYANHVPDELFQSITGALQKAVQQAHERGGNESKSGCDDEKDDESNSFACNTLRNNSSFSEIGATGFEPATSASRTHRPPVTTSIKTRSYAAASFGLHQGLHQRRAAAKAG